MRINQRELKVKNYQKTHSEENYTTITTEEEVSDPEEEDSDTADENKRQRKKLAWMTSGEFVCLALQPNSFSEAMKSNEKNNWLKAMHKELKFLKENNTWKLVKRPK